MGEHHLEMKKNRNFYHLCFLYGDSGREKKDPI